MTTSFRRFKFTQKALAELTPGEKPIVWYDEKTEGLGVRVSPKGRLTFIVLQGSRTKSLKAKTLDGARELVDQMRVREDVIISEWTLGEVFRSWLELKAKPKKKTWKRDLRRWQTHLVRFDKVRLNAITKTQLIQLHNELKESAGPYAANDTLVFVSSLYTFAQDVHDYEGRNPAKRIERFPEQERERYLLPEEFPRWFAAVNELSLSTSRDFFLMLLWTGVRREAVLAMQWAHVDLKATVWRVPKEDDKGKRDLIIYLSDEALKILRTRKATAKTPWVFPSGNGSASGHYADPKTAWRQILKRSGIRDLRIHDLRRTLGSWMAEQGTSLPIIGKTLGHKSMQATAIYARLGGAPVRLAVNEAIRRMNATVE